MREVIYADRRGGKTTKLVDVVKYSDNAVLAVHSYDEIGRIQMNYDMPRNKLVTYENIMRGSGRISDRNVAVYIDNVDKFLEYVVGNIRVAGFSVTKEGTRPLWESGILPAREEGDSPRTERFRNTLESLAGLEPARTRGRRPRRPATHAEQPVRPVEAVECGMDIATPTNTYNERRDIVTWVDPDIDGRMYEFHVNPSERDLIEHHVGDHRIMRDLISHFDRHGQLRVRQMPNFRGIEGANMASVVFDEYLVDPAVAVRDELQTTAMAEACESCS